MPAESAAVEPGTETILLVEDEANLRYLARQFLEKQGYRVIEAADGAVAMQIAVAHEGTIHLLLTDVIMPGMNGRELAQRISEIRPNVKILYMSGYTENVIGRNGTLDEGVRLLQKPFSLHNLKNKVREVLDTIPQEVAMSAQTAQVKAVQALHQLPATRAQRFQLHLPLKYRRLNEEKWHDGETKNISRSGLLFQAEDLVAAECDSGNQSGAAGGDCRTFAHRSDLQGRSRAYGRVERRENASGTGREDSSVSLPAWIAAAAGVKSRTQYSVPRKTALLDTRYWVLGTGCQRLLAQSLHFLGHGELQFFDSFAGHG